MNIDQVLSRANLDSLGCKLWLPLDTDLSDYSGNGNDGTAVGTLQYKAKNGRKYRYLDGVDDKISADGVLSDLDFTLTGNITWCFWFKVDSSYTEQWIQGFSVDATWTKNCIIFSGNNATTGDIRCRMRDDGSIYPTVNSVGPYYNNWYFITLIKNGDDVELFVNGESVGADTTTGLNGTRTIACTSFDIGWSYSNIFAGKIKTCNHFIFDGILTNDEIRKLYNATYIE